MTGGSGVGVRTITLWALTLIEVSERGRPTGNSLRFIGAAGSRQKTSADASGRLDRSDHEAQPTGMSAPSCQLYLITPPTLADLDAFAGRLAAALEAGPVAALQIRLKPADDATILKAVERLAPVAWSHGVAVILNDRPDLAKQAGCDGVHLGREDMDVAAARRVLGPQMMIGATCHDSRHLAMEAAEAGAAYVAFGAFFPTGTKETTHRPDPEILTVWQETMETPCVAIGGITLETAPVLVAAGADFLAVSAGVWAHPKGPARAIVEFTRLLST